MLARLVENWLTSVGELGYQRAFAQLLAAEGHTILVGPIHHGFEHGKDIIAMAPDGALCAYQLKGPDEIRKLAGLESHQGQIEALAMSAIEHSSLPAPRLADRVYVVTNGDVRPEVLDRLIKISHGFVLRRLPPLTSVTKAELVSRFVNAHGEFLPSEPEDFRALVELFAADGSDPLEVGKLLAFLGAQVDRANARETKLSAGRALASATLLVSYCLQGHARRKNYLAIAQGWLALCLTVLRVAEEEGLEAELWETSYLLGRAAAVDALAGLLDESCAVEDLVVPHMMDGAFYGSRVLLVTGYLSALFCAGRIAGEDWIDWARLRMLLLREMRYLRVLGESAAGHVLLVASAISHLESSSAGEQWVVGYLSGLLRRNAPRALNPMPDPYHGVEELLEATFVPNTGAEIHGERFDGRSYTAQVAVEWLARRLRRQAVAAAWRHYTKVLCCEHVLSRPSGMLSAHDDDGALRARAPRQPGSWRDLRREALTVDFQRVPKVLTRQAEFLPFLVLLLPQRLTPDIGRLLDFHLFPTADFVVSP